MTARSAILWSTGLAALTPAFLPMACVDTEPVVVEEVRLDAGADANGPCGTCVQAPSEPGPGCADVLDDCNEHERCKLTMECAFASGCLELPTISVIVSCGIDCTETTGIAQDQEAITALTAVFTCLVGACAPSCGTAAADASAD
jgi:hypothetical protein